MKTSKQSAIDYGNWVPVKMLKMSGTISIVLICLGILLLTPLMAFWHTPIKLFAGVLLLVIGIGIGAVWSYFYYCHQLFDYRKKHQIQKKILLFVLSFINKEKTFHGEILDIGCGSGALSIRTAKTFWNAHITGVDYWGSEWDYAQKQCEKNALTEGVSQRVRFLKGDAAKLEFADETFDGAVSNFVFHEVNTQPNKRLVVWEALRVIKKGGFFVFHDLFLEQKLYGNMEEFLEELREKGITKVEIKYTNDEMNLPGALKTGFMLGKTAVIYGIK